MKSECSRQQTFSVAHSPPHRDDPRITQALEEYIAAVDAGEKPDRQALLDRFADVADELGSCLDGIEFIHDVAPQLNDQETGQPQSGPHSHAPATLGDYRVIRQIGRGGMGVVYEAEQISLHRRVALKVLPFAAVLDQKQLARFKNEAQAAALLQHQNIVPVYSVGCERGVHYYAMQYIVGESLAEVIQQLRREEVGVREGAEGSGVSNVASDLASGKFASPKPATGNLRPGPSVTASPEHPSSVTTDDTVVLAGLSTDRSSKSSAYVRSVAKLGIQAAEALEHAHTNGVLHRDIKPANLLLDVNGNLWITDFGLARVGTDPGLTLSGDLLGTLRYISPEQALGHRVVVDHRTDIYSLGVTLYELLTLRPAYDGNDRHELMRKIAFEEPRLPTRINKAIPAEIETIVLKAMSKDPNERYATAHELADDFERFLEDKPIQAKRPNLRQRAVKWSRRHKPLVWTMSAAMAIVLLTIAAALAVVANRERSVAHRERLGRLEAEHARNQIARQLAEGYLHRAQGLCESGDVALGMLWMVRSLQHTPADAIDLQLVIRRNLAAWSRQLNPLAAIFEHEGGVRTLAFTPDGSRLLIGSYDGTAQLWDPAMGIPIGPPFQHEDVVWAVTMSADGLRVLTGSADWTARLWEPATGAPIGEPLLHEDQLRAVVFSANGSRILTGSHDGIARVWEADTGKLIAITQERHENGVPVVAFSPDESIFVTGSSDGTARLWLAATGEPISEPLECKHWVKAAAFSADGSRLMTLSADGSTRLWDVDAGKLVGKTFYNTGSVAYAAVSPDGSRYLLASSSKTARLWDIGTAGALRQPLRHSQGGIWNVAFSPDGSALVTASANHGGEVRVWAPNIGFALGPALKHQDEGTAIRAVAFSADGSRLITGTSGVGCTQLWDAANGRPIGEPLEVGGEVLAFSADGARVLTRPKITTAQVWDVATGKPVGKPLQHKAHIFSTALSRDGSRVLIGCGNRTAYLWDADTGQLSRTILHPRGMGIISPVAFSPDGSRLVTGQATTVRLWDVATGEPEGALLEHQDSVRALAISPDGSRILTGLMDGTAWVWELSTGKRIHGPLEHEADIGAVAFSPDGAILLTASLDATARFWDAATGKPLGPPLRHEVGVVAAAFCRDGSRILTGCDDGTARLWRASPPAIKTGLDRTVLWTQVITGLELDESSGEVHVLDDSSWHRSRELLEKLGGLPESALQTVPAKSPAWSHDLLIWHRVMARSRAREKQWPEAVRHLDVLLKAEPESWWYLSARGRANAELNQWQKAADDYAEATRLAPHNWTVWRRYAETQAAIGDLAGYRNTCRTLLKRFGETKGVLAARGIASTCTLAPNAVEDFQRPLELAQTAADAGSLSHWSDQSIRGALLFRAGRFEEAVETLKEQIAACQRQDVSPAYSSFAYSSFFLAMAYQRLGNAEQARSWFDNARRSTKQFTGAYHDDPWHSLALQLLRREAESLLESASDEGLRR